MARIDLGAAYYGGQGVAKDYAEAVKWYRKAAEQNAAGAQYNLGVCYDKGDGVAKDYVEAYKWWLLAAGQGAGDARNSVTLLEDKMTREQIAEGQKLARNFRPREVPASDGRDNSFERPSPRTAPVMNNEKSALLKEFQMASNDVASAQFSVGMRYINGDGVETNRPLGLYWIYKASYQDLPAAKEFLRAHLQP